MADNKSMTGLTEEEAQEFHGIFVQSMTGLLGSGAPGCNRPRCSGKPSSYYGKYAVVCDLPPNA